jgi:hypothetical protein
MLDSRPYLRKVTIHTFKWPALSLQTIELQFTRKITNTRKGLPLIAFRLAEGAVQSRGKVRLQTNIAQQSVAFVAQASRVPVDIATKRATALVRVDNSIRNAAALQNIRRLCSDLCIRVGHHASNQLFHLRLAWTAQWCTARNSLERKSAHAWRAVVSQGAEHLGRHGNASAERDVECTQSDLGVFIKQRTVDYFAGIRPVPGNQRLDGAHSFGRRSAANLLFHIGSACPAFGRHGYELRTGILLDDPHRRAARKWIDLRRRVEGARRIR